MAVNGVLQLNEVKQIEQTIVAPKEDAAKIGKELNGINTSVNEIINASNVDKLVEKLCAEFSKLGLTPQQLKQSNIISRISGMNEAQLNNASEQSLNRIYECIKIAIKDSIVNGNVNIDKAIKLGNNYNTALTGEWASIETFKAANKNNNDDISARMERFFGLKKGSFATLPQEKIEEYLERYFKQYFLDEVKKSKNPEKTYKKQLQDFTKLLVNTPDEQKAVFRQAIVSLQASNRLKGLDSVLKSFDTQEARTEWADGCDTKFTKAFATNADAEGNVPKQSEVTAAVSKVTEQKSEEGIRTHQEALQKEAVEFFEKNKDALARIAEKIEKREPLTEEEKQLVLLRDNYFTAAKAGEITGTALNQIIAAEVRDNLLDKMNRDAYELPIYKEVMTQVTEFVENNPDTLALPKDQLVKLLDKVTNGNYSEVVNNRENANIKAPAVKSSDKADAVSESGCGYQTAPASVIEERITSLDEKRQIIAEESDEKAPKFEVAVAESHKYQEAKKNGMSAVLNFFKETKNSMYKREVAKTVAKDNNRVQITNKGGNQLAIYVNQARQFTDDEIAKLKNISGIVKNAMKSYIKGDLDMA